MMCRDVELPIVLTPSPCCCPLGVWFMQCEPALHGCTAGCAGKDGQQVASKYDLVANILHDGKAGEGTYRAHIHRKSEDAWCACSLHAMPVCCFSHASSTLLSCR